MHTNYALPDATDHTCIDNKDINQMVSYNISSCPQTNPLEPHSTRDARSRNMSQALLQAYLQKQVRISSRRFGYEEKKRENSP